MSWLSFDGISRIPPTAVDGPKMNDVPGCLAEHYYSNGDGSRSKILLCSLQNTNVMHSSFAAIPIIATLARGMIGCGCGLPWQGAIVGDCLVYLVIGG